MQRSIPIVSIIAILIALVGCGGQVSSGIVGNVTFGHRCLNRLPGRSCEAAPYRAAFTITDDQGELVATITPATKAYLG